MSACTENSKQNRNHVLKECDWLQRAADHVLIGPEPQKGNFGVWGGLGQKLSLTEIATRRTCQSEEKRPLKHHELVEDILK